MKFTCDGICDGLHLLAQSIKNDKLPCNTANTGSFETREDLRLAFISF